MRRKERGHRHDEGESEQCADDGTDQQSDDHAISWRSSPGRVPPLRTIGSANRKLKSGSRVGLSRERAGDVPSGHVDLAGDVPGLDALAACRADEPALESVAVVPQRERW